MIAINTSSHQGHSEIDILGTNADFASLTERLTELSAGVFSLKYKPNAHFPVAMRLLSVEPVSQSEGVITAQIEDLEGKILGDSQAFQKFTEFLKSLSTLSPGEHFHLDWFANEDLLAPATNKMSFIFSIEA